MSKIRVLLVDDHMVVRIGLKALIDAEQDLVVVGEASNGVEGVAKAIALTPDVSVMDISMPELVLSSTARACASGPHPDHSAAVGDFPPKLSYFSRNRALHLMGYDNVRVFPASYGVWEAEVPP